MKKMLTFMAISGMAVSGASADELFNIEQGKVADSRYILASSDEMKCGKEMKKKAEKCKKMMENMKCGAEMMEEMKECKEIMDKMKSKDKSKEMVCGQCGAMM